MLISCLAKCLIVVRPKQQQPLNQRMIDFFLYRRRSQKNAMNVVADVFEGLDDAFL